MNRADKIDFLLTQIETMRLHGNQLARALEAAGCSPADRFLIPDWDKLVDSLSQLEPPADHLRAAGQKLREVVASFKVATPAMDHAVRAWDTAASMGVTLTAQAACTFHGHLKDGVGITVDVSPARCGYCDAVLPQAYFDRQRERYAAVKAGQA